MATPGIIITQVGIDVKTAADYQMIFNSNWPSLQIAFEARVDVPYGKIVPVAHNLGFFPLTMAWAILNNVSIGRVFAPSGTLSNPQTDVKVTFDKNNIYLDNTSPVYNFTTYTISIKCYNLDITKAVNYTAPVPPTFKTPYDASFGIKVVKSGKAITSTDLRDFILHSRAQSPAILSVVTQPTTNPTAAFTAPTIQYKNPAGYTPWVLGFYSSDGGLTYAPVAPGAQQSSYIFAQIGDTSYLNSFQGAAIKGSIVVLRDPLVVANQRRVTYG